MSFEAARMVSMVRWLLIAVMTVGGATCVATAKSDEISVLSASAMTSVMTNLAHAFERETGYSVALTFATAGEVEKRVLAGEPTDVAITTDAAMERIAGQGLVVRATNVTVARTGLGIGVREGTRKPDILTVDGFVKTVLAAKSITYPDPARGGASGIHFAQVIERLGIAHILTEKTVLGATPEAVCGAVAKGEVELCVHQISEILPVKGVTLVGPLPPDVQKITTFVAAVSARSSMMEAAKAFLTFLTRPSLAAKFSEAGLDYRALTPSPERRSAPASWALHRNTSFDFALRYPVDVFMPEGGQADGGLHLFVSRDGRARFRISSFPNKDAATLAKYRRSLMDTRYVDAVYDYTPQRNNWFVLSGTRGEEMFYERVTFSCDGQMIHGWQLTYPLTERKFYDEIVEKVHRSYRFSNCPKTGHRQAHGPRRRLLSPKP
jgi:molybdate transport system substrate-binding protein